MSFRPPQSGFSLVELSIVLVILGLLTGGILAGQSLIRAAELRSVSTEYNRWAASTQTFRDKYFGLPGDISNATAFWGKDAANCNAHTGTVAANGTCNGNANGQIEWAAGAAATGESMQYWKHLALAGLVEGSYTGISTGCTYCQSPGITYPSSRLSNAGWTTAYLGTQIGHPQWFDGNYGSAMFFGAWQGYTSAVALKPEEAWNIDTKMDDGRPAIGKVRSWLQTFHPNCTDSTTLNANYTLTQSSLSCALIFEL